MRNSKGYNRIVHLSIWAQWGNPNTYVNLARLFAGSPWILSILPTPEPLLPNNEFSRIVSQLDLRIQTVDPTLLFQTEIKSTAIESLLIPQYTPVWCPSDIPRLA